MAPKHQRSDAAESSQRKKRQKHQNDAVPTSRVTRSQTSSGSAPAANPLGNEEEEQHEVPNDNVEEDPDESTPESYSDSDSDSESDSESDPEDYNITEEADEPQIKDKPVKKGEWEIMPKDSNTPIVWKKSEPARLTITFRRKDQPQDKRPYPFPMDEKDFDFNNPNHVRRLNRFRTKLCDYYLGKSPRTGRWTWIEEAFLEVWLRKSALGDGLYEISMGKDEVLNAALNEYFRHRGDIFFKDGRVVDMNHDREKGTIDNKKRHKYNDPKKDGVVYVEVEVDIDFSTYTSLEKAHKLCGPISWTKGKGKSKCFIPCINDDILRHFKKHHEVRLTRSDIKQLDLKFTKRPGNEQGRKKTHVDQQQPGPEKRKMDMEKTVADQLGLVEVGSSDPKPNKPGSKEPGSNEPKPGKVPPIAPPGDPGSDSESDSSSDSGPPFNPPMNHGRPHGNPGDPGSDQEIRNEHLDSRTGTFSALRTALPHPESEYRWMGMPQNDDEALLRHLDENDRAGHDLGYIDALKNDFVTRFDQHGFPPRLPYSHQKAAQKKRSLNTAPKWQVRWYYYRGDQNVGDEHDGNFKRTNLERLEYRGPEAAGASALVNAATIPPVGYMGHTHRLVDQKLLSKEELDLHREGHRARKLMFALHDRLFYSLGDPKEQQSDDEGPEIGRALYPMESKSPTQSEFDNDDYDWPKKAQGRQNELVTTRNRAAWSQLGADIDDLYSQYNRTWNSWVGQTDLQTGVIYDSQVAEAMTADLIEPREQLVRKHRTKRWAGYWEAVAQKRLQELLCRQNFYEKDPTKKHRVEGTMRERIAFLERLRKGPIPRSDELVGDPNYQRSSSALQDFVNGRQLYTMKTEEHRSRIFKNLRTEQENYLILHTNGQQIGFEVEMVGKKETKEFLLEGGKRVPAEEIFKDWNQESWDRKKAAQDEGRQDNRPLRGEPSSAATVGQGSSERLFNNFVASYMARSRQRQDRPLRRVSENITLRLCKAGEAGAREGDLDKSGILPETDVVVVQMKDVKRKGKGKAPAEWDELFEEIPPLRNRRSPSLSPSFIPDWEGRPPKQKMDQAPEGEASSSKRPKTS